MIEVVNTAQFRFPPGSARPSWEEIANFVKQLDTDPLDMETVYKTSRDRSLFVKFTSQEAMRESLKNNSEPRTFTYANGESVVVVRMCCAGTNMHYVRVFDLPPEVGDYNLAQVLGSYGIVDRVLREKFPSDSGLDHLYTGARGVHIDVKKRIPPAVDVLNMKARVFYSELSDTCFLCHAVRHRRDTCPQRGILNMKEKQQQEAVSSNTYAGVLAGKEVVGIPVETVEDEIIEIIEEEVLDEPPSDSAEEKQTETLVREPAAAADSDREIRRKKGIQELEKVAKAIQEAITNQNASQHRAQFAASRSGSGSGSAPKKKCARKTYY